MKIWKEHGKLKYSESRYCFANISAREARIFMKFVMVVNLYLVNLSFKFHKDPCINMRTRVVNARIRDKTCVRALSYLMNERKPVSAFRLLSSPCDKSIVFISSRGSPCSIAKKYHAFPNRIKRWFSLTERQELFLDLNIDISYLMLHNHTG